MNKKDNKDKILKDLNIMKLISTEEPRQNVSGSYLGFNPPLNLKSLLKVGNETSYVRKLKEKESVSRGKKLLERLQSESEGDKLKDLLNMTQRGIEFLIDCFDELQNEKLIDENFLIYDAQKEFLKMQEVFFPAKGFDDEVEFKRQRNQIKIDFILKSISKMDEDKLDRIYKLMNKGFKHE